MGALVGALVAAGLSPENINGLIAHGGFDDLFTTRPSFSRLSIRRRQDREDLPQAISFGLRSGVVPLGNALITDNQLNAFLARQLLAYNTEALSFDDLPIPFRCVATDLTTLRPFVFSSGSLSLAVRASISIPGVFPPVNKGGDILVDGAIVDNLPTDVLREDMHADVVIAVHLSDAAFAEKDATSLFGIFARAFQAGTNRNEELSRKQADIQILPAVDAFSSSDYSKAAALVKAGYDAAERQRGPLLAHALDEDDWKAYRADLAAKIRPAPGIIKTVRVDGPDAVLSAQLARNADRLQGKTFNVSRAEAMVADTRADGALDAYYETYRMPVATQGETAAAQPDNGVLLHWRRKGEGPPYLLLGTEIVAVSSNVSQIIVDGRFVDQNLGGYGSELRSDVRLGYLTHLGTEYYRPVGRRGFFLQPSVQFLRQPVYLWQDQQRVSERLLQRAGGGLDAGVSIPRNFQAALEYRASTVRWVLKDGIDVSPTQHYSGMVESAAAHVTYNDNVAEIASPRGSRADLVVGHLFPSTASHQSAFLRFSGRRSFTLRDKNVLGLSAEVNTYFRANVADPLRFTLGGPLRLYASSVDEYRGTDTILTRAAYLRRFATLPTGLGQGIYFAGGYEAGEIWRPEQHSVLRQDVFGGVLLNTPLGALTLGGAVGDDGHRKGFLTFGKLF